MARTMNWPWLELQIVVLPSAATLMRQGGRSLAPRGHADEAGVRLDVALMHRARCKRALDDDVGLSESLRDIALLQLELAGDVGRLAVELVELVEDRRVGLQRIIDLDRERKHFVVDFDQLAGFGGNR